MRIEDLSLHEVVIEVRFPNTFRVFDHAGEVAERIASNMPNWELTKANPVALEFARPAFGLQAIVAINHIRVNQVRTEGYPDIKGAEVFMSDFAKILTPALSIYSVHDFERIGYRRVYHYKERDAVNLMKVWDELPFKITTPANLPAPSKPGSMVMYFKMENALSLRFALENIGLAATVGSRNIDLNTMRIAGLPKAHALDERLDVLRETKRRLQFLPRFGISVDLDWYREDVLSVAPEYVEKFIRECDTGTPLMLGALK